MRGMTGFDTLPPHEFNFEGNSPGSVPATSPPKKMYIHIYMYNLSTVAACSRTPASLKLKFEKCTAIFQRP